MLPSVKWDGCSKHYIAQQAVPAMQKIDQSRFVGGGSLHPWFSICKITILDRVWFDGLKSTCFRQYTIQGCCGESVFTVFLALRMFQWFVQGCGAGVCWDILQIPICRIVEGLTGIFCSISDGPGTYLSRPIFDRKIDLKWFGNDQNEFSGVNCKKLTSPLE